MSEETMQWLNDMTRIGYTAERGNAWHWREGSTNHYPGPVPWSEVEKLLTLVHVNDSDLFMDRSGRYEGVPGWKVLYNDAAGPLNGEIYGVHGEGYSIEQYTDGLMKDVQSMLGADATVGQCGLLKNGARAWVSIEMKDTPSVQGIQFRPQLMATSSHDGSLASIKKGVVTIVVCDNTRAAALSESGSTYKRKHTKNMSFNVHDALQAVGLLDQMAENFSAEVERELSIEVSDQMWSKFLEQYVPLPEVKAGEKTNALTIAERKREDLSGLYFGDARVKPFAGTAFGVLQATNTYVQHEGKFKGGNRAERNMVSTLGGQFAAADEKALAALLEVMQPV